MLRPDDAADSPRLLIPKPFDQSLASKLLDRSPAELQSIDLAGAVLLLPDQPPPPEAADLRDFRDARVQKRPLPVNDVTLSRASTSELLDLVSVHGLHVAARALQLRSLPAREELVTHLGHQRVADLLSRHPELPERVVWQTMRSRGFSPGDMRIPPDDVVSLAGNPNLTQEQQVQVVDALLSACSEGDLTAEAPLARAAASESLPELAAEMLTVHVDSLPRRVRLALASNETADWLWLRKTLDAHIDPETALASSRVGELGVTRRAVLTNHPDPVVRAKFLGSVPDTVWDWSHPEHVEVLRLIDDPLAPAKWSLEPSEMDPTLWGAYSVSRQWAARSDRHQQAEAELRHLVDLHNRSWGAVGRGQGDPALAARAAAARAVAGTVPALKLLGLDEGRTYTVEDARLRAVQVTAARPWDELRSHLCLWIAPVLEACAAEAGTALPVEA